MGQRTVRPIPQIIAAIKADADITAVVGDKVFADYPPQGIDHPFVILTIPSGTAHGTVDNCGVRAYSARLEVDVLCETRAKTEAVIESMEDLLDGFASTDSTHPIQGITVDGGLEWELLTPKDGSDERIYICSQDYEIHYRRILTI